MSGMQKSIAIFCSSRLLHCFSQLDCDQLVPRRNTTPKLTWKCWECLFLCFYFLYISEQRCLDTTMFLFVFLICVYECMWLVVCLCIWLAFLFICFLWCCKWWGVVFQATFSSRCLQGCGIDVDIPIFSIHYRKKWKVSYFDSFSSSYKWSNEIWI